MKKNNIIFILGFLFTFGSCSDESGPIFSDSKGVPTRLSLHTLEMKAATRSTPPLNTEYESKVVHLQVLQFAYSSDGSGTLLRKEGFVVTDPLDIEITLTPNASGQLSKLYFIANMEKATFPEVGGMTEAQFKTKVTDQIGSEGGFLLQNTTESGRYIPMFGEVKDPVSVGADGLLAQLNVSLVRMLARVDVIYKVSDGSNFSLRSIRACNIPNKISYYRSTDALGIPVYESGVESPVISNASQDLQDFAYEGSVNSSSTPTTLTFYLPPNHRGLGDNLDGNMDERLKLGKDFASYLSFTGFSSKIGEDVMFKFYPGKDAYNDYNIDCNTRYTINVAIEGAYLSDPRITVLPKKIISSNCYMLAPGEEVYIPIIRANEGQKIVGVTPIPNLQSPDCTASIVWQTAPNLVSIDASTVTCTGGIFKVKVPSGSPEGNAVVQIKNSSDETLWSWHIWVTSYKPDLNTVTGPASFIFMDRNLGATTAALPDVSLWTAGAVRTDVGSFGLMYQWGRKDPFPGSKSVTVNSTATLTTNVGSDMSIYDGNGVIMNSVNAPALAATTTDGLQLSIKKPFTFLKGSGANNTDWYSTTAGTRNDTLWASVKTIYDPCPAGWRVPPPKCWSTFNITTFPVTDATRFIGRSFSSYKYPAVGYRSRDSGLFLSVGSYAMYWMAGANTFNAYTLNFGNTTVGNDSASASRAFGNPVRCVKE